MKIFLVRHGQDDDSVRGGWSDTALTDSGLLQSYELAEELFSRSESYNIGRIVSSDLYRAKQTAEIIAEKLNLPVTYNSDFREVNNGKLAGLDNKIAEIKYPDLYWRSLDWEERYPNGESPKDFYERVSNAWNNFSRSLDGCEKNILIVTHGGVINIIKCLVGNSEYSNKQKYESIPSAKICFEAEI